MITDAKIIPFLGPIKVFALIMRNQIYSLDFERREKRNYCLAYLLTGIVTTTENAVLRLA